MKLDSADQLETGTTSCSAPASGAWRHAFPLLCALVVWTLAWYASTAAAIVEIWRRSDTFAHGFVIVPIVLWLAWQRRGDVARMTPRPAWFALPLLGAAGFVWLLGELAAVNVVTQLALYGFLVLTPFVLLGTAVFAKLIFPLAFLFFAVPVGEFLMPRLMEWTADFTEIGLRLSGIPVHREGQQFIIPSGNWSVVEACSGIRYLIASAMVGTLFAYLTYRSWQRRLVFILVALAVPIVANWLRAYMIVLLGHLSGNKLAAGVDHLIYGWLFFGVVIGAIFWIGARWREEAPTLVPGHPPPPGGADVSLRQLFGAAICVALLGAGWKMAYARLESTDASSPARIVAVNALSGWGRVPAAEIVKWTPHFENASATLQQTLRRGDKTVGMFIAYYRNQDYQQKLVSSTNVLVKTDDAAWLRAGESGQVVNVGSDEVAVKAAELRSRTGERLLVWHWYWIDGRLTSSDYAAKAYTALARLRGRGDDCAAVIVYATKDQRAGAEAALRDFTRDAGGAIGAMLSKTRESR